MQPMGQVLFLGQETNRGFEKMSEPMSARQILSQLSQVAIYLTL